MALGATQAGVFALVIMQGLRLSPVGTVVGLAGALAGNKLIANRLHGVKALDPSTFITAALLLTAVAVLASYLPARRAAAMDPVEALRQK